MPKLVNCVHFYSSGFSDINSQTESAAKWQKAIALTHCVRSTDLNDDDDIDEDYLF